MIFPLLSGGLRRRKAVPLQISGLAFNYVAGPSYCFSDAGGTVPCADGDTVQVWRDRSGNGRNLVQATAGSRPVLRSVSGKWEVQFDGVDDGMLTATFGPLALTAYDVSAVFYFNAVVNLAIACEARNTGDAGNAIGANIFQQGALSVAGRCRNNAGTLVTLDTSILMSTMKVFETRWDGSTLYAKNGGAADVTGALTGTTTVNVLGIGRNAFSVSDFSTVRIRELVFYSRYLTVAERTKLRAYTAGVAA